MEAYNLMCKDLVVLLFLLLHSNIIKNLLDQSPFCEVTNNPVFWTSDDPPHGF